MSISQKPQGNNSRKRRNVGDIDVEYKIWKVFNPTNGISALKKHVAGI